MKTLKLISLALLMLVITSNIIGQSDDIELKHDPNLDAFKLKNYYLPHLKYDRLDLSLLFNSDNNSYNPNSKSNENFSINSGIYLSNYSYRNSPKLQMRCANSLYFDAGYEKRYDNIEKKSIKNKAIISSLNLNNSFRFYNNSKWFFELEAISDLSIKDGKHNGFYIRDYNEGLRLGVNTGFYIGHGRIEDVTDAWYAINLLKDFKRISRLAKTPDKDDIFSLANAIAQAKNIRSFDRRIKVIKQLKTIDSTLTKRTLINNNDIDYFTSLNDLYSIFRFHRSRRNAGSIIALGLIPHYNYYLDNEGKFKQDFTSYGLTGKFKNEYYKPINMFYQVDFGYSLSTNYTILKNYFPGGHNTKNSFIGITPKIYTTFSYFPSTRTAFSSKLNLSYTNTFFPDEDFKNSISFFTASLSNRLTYYISPRSRINLNLDLYYLTSEDFVSISTNHSIIEYFGNSIRYSQRPLDKGTTYFLSFKYQYAIF